MTPKQGHKAPESRDKEQRVNSKGIVKETPVKKKEVKNEFICHPTGLFIKDENGESEVYFYSIDPTPYLQSYNRMVNLGIIGNEIKFDRFPKDDEHEFNKL